MRSRVGISKRDLPAAQPFDNHIPLVRTGLNPASYSLPEPGSPGVNAYWPPPALAIEGWVFNQIPITLYGESHGPGLVGINLITFTFPRPVQPCPVSAFTLRAHNGCCGDEQQESYYKPEHIY